MIDPPKLYIPIIFLVVAALAALDAEQFDVEPLPKTQGEAFVQLWTDEDGKA